MGERVAMTLWPALRLTGSGSSEDLIGIDGYLEGRTVQIKADARIALSGKVFHEIYKKTGQWSSFGQPNSLRFRHYGPARGPPAPATATAEAASGRTTRNP